MRLQVWNVLILSAVQFFSNVGSCVIRAKFIAKFLPLLAIKLQTSYS
jgi:hypothetical protein